MKTRNLAHVLHCDKAYIAKKAWQGYPRSGHKTTSKRIFRLVKASVFFILVHHSVLAFPHLCSGKKSGSGSSQPLPFLSLPWRGKHTQTAKDNEHEYCVQVEAWTTWIQLRTSELDFHATQHFRDLGINQSADFTIWQVRQLPPLEARSLNMSHVTAQITKNVGKGWKRTHQLERGHKSQKHISLTWNYHHLSEQAVSFRAQALVLCAYCLPTSANCEFLRAKRMGLVGA